MTERRWVKHRYPQRVEVTAVCQHCGLKFKYTKTFKPRKYHRECAREVQIRRVRENNKWTQDFKRQQKEIQRAHH